MDFGALEQIFFPGRSSRRFIFLPVARIHGLLPPVGGQLFFPLPAAIVGQTPAETVFVQDAEKILRPGRSLAGRAPSQFRARSCSAILKERTAWAKSRSADSRFVACRMKILLSEKR
jgi:hypothetical protein